MTVARAAQDEVETVKREMEERLKAAQEAVSQQVVYMHTCIHSLQLTHSFQVCHILVYML